MRNLIWTSIGILMAVFMGGCAAFEDPSQRATENAESTIVAKTISAVDIQAETVTALRATADGAAQMTSNLTAAVSERNNLQATINAMNGVTTGINVNPTQIPIAGNNPTALDGGSVAGQGPSPSPSSGAIYGLAQTTTELDSNFCPTSNVETFPATTEVIYFVVVVQNLGPGQQFSMRVSSTDGMALDEDPNFWVSDTTYDRTCIYYGLDSNNFAFLPGTYRVAFLENGVEKVSATFSIN